MLELKDKKYVIATEDGGIIGAYHDLEDAKIDAQDAWETHGTAIQILETVHNHMVHDGIFLKIYRKIEWEPEEKTAEAEEEAEEKATESQDEAGEEKASSDEEKVEEKKEEDDKKK